MRICTAICLALATVACGGAARQEGVPADQVGLSKVGISEVPTPPGVTDNASEPGEQPPGPAAFADALARAAAVKNKAVPKSTGEKNGKNESI